MYCDAATHCCAINEFEGLNNSAFTPKEAIKAIGAAFFDAYRDVDEQPMFAHVVMFQKYNSYGTTVEQGCKNLNDFAAFVTANKLGTVTMGITKKNPNSGNMVKPAIFTPSITGMTEWLKANKLYAPARGEDDGYRW